MKLSEQTKCLRAGAAGSAVTTAQTLTSIDTFGFDSVSFLLPAGSTVDAVAEIQVSADDSTWTTVTDHQLTLVADTVMVIDCHRLDRRYVRLRITPSTATTYGAAIALLSDSIDLALPLTAAANRLIVVNKPAAA